MEGVPAEEADALTNAGLMKTADYLGTYFISFQNQRPPFDDPRVRKAFSLVIDSPYLTQTVTGTGEVPASAFVPPGVYDAGGAGQADFRNVGGGYWQVPLTDALYEENCRQARELLAQAGYPGGAGFPPVEYLYSTDQRNRLIAEALQSMWAQELGVRVNLVNQDWNSTLQTCFDGEYDMAAAVWTADYNDPISFLGTWQSEGGNNIARYQSAAFDEALAQAAVTQDAQARMKELHRAEELLLGEDQSLAPLYFYALTYCADPGLTGIYYTPLGYFFFGQVTRAS
ncbi:Periplasmic oligopeptide-binding protein [bioreactor metagenome]|uniref:Periplasmic oligopeptide-binding protein n=1 Tax=bioreactor metagenome TaxID=1076179 RepID=A0A645DH57_9ZZZZ